jgi:hypothetical protein
MGPLARSLTRRRVELATAPEHLIRQTPNTLCKPLPVRYALCVYGVSV